MGFILDLRRLGDGTSRLSEVVSPDDLGIAWTGITFEPEIRLSIVIARAGNDLDIELKFEGERCGECDRCLRPFRESYSGALRAIGRRGGPEHELAGQDGVVFHDGHRMDLTDEVREAILIDIPIQHLCSPACLGLCPSCGVNRNTESCACRSDHVDPRWEALRPGRESE